MNTEERKAYRQDLGNQCRALLQEFHTVYGVPQWKIDKLKELEGKYSASVAGEVRNGQ